MQQRVDDSISTRTSDSGAMAKDIFDVSSTGLRREVARAVMDGYGRQDPPPMREPSGRHFIIDQAMGCADPFSIVHGAKALTVTRLLRCRKCAVCLEHHRRYWRARSIAEFSKSATSWFGTLTMRPEIHFMLDASIESYCASRGVDIREMTPDELFRARVSEYGREVTKWLKRLRHHRKGARLRYMLLAEKHDSPQTSEEMRGRPHIHILLHEQKVGELISITDYYPKGKRVYVTDDCLIKQQWTLGFSKFELMTNWKAVSYITKYMHKSRVSRVRASLRYGQDDPVRLSRRD